jgi:hypothetical protein
MVILVNKNTYDVQVPTPNGGSRILHEGEAVVGRYFEPHAQQLRLTRISSEAVKSFDKRHIVLNLDPVVEVVEKEEVNTPEVPVEPPPFIKSDIGEGTFKSMEETLNSAMVQSSMSKPMMEDIKKMNLKDLNTTAAKFGIAGSGKTKKEIIEAIAAKLG